MTSESRELIPAASQSWVAKILADANLPQLLMGPAGKAISQLVAGAADIPAAYLERLAHRIRARTEAEDQTSRSLAKAVERRISEDDELADRAASAWLPNVVRKQENREAVARAALKALPEFFERTGARSNGEVDPDWLNVFTRYVEDASSERMRDLWGHVLAKEIVSQGSFSLRTIRFMSELDVTTAKAFERMAALVFDDDGVDVPETLTAEQYRDVFLADQAGLMRHGDLVKEFVVGEDGIGFIPIRKGELVVTGVPNITFDLSCGHLTQIGVEVLQILPHSPDESVALSIAKRIPRTGVKSIEWDENANGGRKLLWSKEA